MTSHAVTSSCPTSVSLFSASAPTSEASEAAGRKPLHSYERTGSADSRGIPVEMPLELVAPRRIGRAPSLATVPENLRTCLHANVKPRMEVLKNGAYPVWDLSGVVRETPARNFPDLKVVRGNEMFAPGTVFLAFGLPNVYLAEVNNSTDIIKVDAKSLRRAPTSLVHTNGRVQSGVFLVPNNLPAEALPEVRLAAQEMQGTYHTTCVHANTRILARSGFTVGNHDITTLMPKKLLSSILDKGIEYKGQPLAFDIYRTTPMTLAEYTGVLDQAVYATPLRHAQRCFDTQSSKDARIRECAAIEAMPVNPLVADEMPDDAPQFSLATSKASSLGTAARFFWGAHTIFKVDIGSADVKVDDYLPDTLKAFPDAHPSLVTRLKRDVLFSPCVLSTLHGHMASRFGDTGSFNEKLLLNLLPRHTGERPAMFNMVVTSDSLMLVRNNVGWKTVDWVLSKHVLVSGYSSDVRFAGELWKDENDRIHFNANSGTYKPQPDHLAHMFELAHAMFPHVDLQAEMR